MGSKPGIWCMEGKWSSTVTDVHSVNVIMEALKDDGADPAGPPPPEHTRGLRTACSCGRSTQLQDRVPGPSRVPEDRVHRRPSRHLEGPRGVRGRHHEGQALHFGSCSVMPRSDTQCQEFRESLGADPSQASPNRSTGSSRSPSSCCSSTPSPTTTPRSRPRTTSRRLRETCGRGPDSSSRANSAAHGLPRRRSAGDPPAPPACRR